jgi:hypothetical protein
MAQKKTMPRDGNVRGKRTVDMIVGKDAETDALMEEITRRAKEFRHANYRAPLTAIHSPSISAAS